MENAGAEVWSPGAQGAGELLHEKEGQKCSAWVGGQPGRAEAEQLPSGRQPRLRLFSRDREGGTWLQRPRFASLPRCAAQQLPDPAVPPRGWSLIPGIQQSLPHGNKCTKGIQCRNP